MASMLSKTSGPGQKPRWAPKVRPLGGGANSAWTAANLVLSPDPALPGRRRRPAR